jgi:type I restriction enzyme S subunit
MRDNIFISGWSVDRLNNICQRITDGSHFSPKPQNFGYFIANVKDMRDDGTIDLSTCTRISKRDFGMLCKNGCSPNYEDVLLSKDGTVGKVVVYRQSENIVVLSSIAILSPDKQIDPDYLGHFFRSSLFERQIEVFKSGSALKRLVLHDIRNLKIAYPSLSEQHWIGQIFDTIEEAIQRTEQLIAKLKAIKQGMLHDLLTRGLDENGQLRDPIAHPEQFKDSALGRIPKGWDVPAIGEISCHVGSGLTPHGGSKVYKNSGVMFIRSQNVTFEGLKLDDIVYIDWKTHQLMKRSEVFHYDVLINITGASIGRCCYLPAEIGPTNVNQHVCAIRLQKPCSEDAIYLAAVLASHIGQRQINLYNAGSNREGLNYQQLRAIIIPWPNKEERGGVSNQIFSFDSYIEAEQRYLSKLKLIKKGLMHDLLTGKVRVNIKFEKA